jgi:hypothetical protein
MARRLLVVLATLWVVVGLVTPTRAASGNVLITRDASAGSYTLAGGGTDDTMTSCSQGRRSQNEPTVAIDPNDPAVVVAGANDYCAAIENGDTWVGYYRSTDGGTTWSDSLVPGYPADETDAGVASPTHGSCAAAGDPSQSFDAEGNLFYAFICFNRSGPVNGSMYVARYTDDGATYDRTVLIKRGTPSGLFQSGLFQDKVNLAVDQTAGANSGNVYVAWSQYNGFAPTNAVMFSRSTDGGLSYSRPRRLTPTALGTASFADLAVGPDGKVYLTYLTYPSSSNPSTDVWLQTSTNGGASFGAPFHVASIEQLDSLQFSGGTGTSDCGDGPYACASGLTFSRFFSSSAVAADETGVHVVWAARVDVDGQTKIFARNFDGTTWSDPAQLDTETTGHQWFPDIASAEGKITVVFYDSRGDPNYAPDLPPGDTADGHNSGDVVNTMIATSTDGGASWTETPVTTHASNFGWETHGSRRIGFWGDYIYVSAVPGAVNVVWTDSRDLVPGSDPREIGGADDGDGFDVYQPCTYVPNDIDAASYTQPTIDDPCLSQGGLDQNIYGART